MVLGYNKRFVDPILSGDKIHTIRTDAHDRWRKDMSIQMYTGVRTKAMQKFKDDTCKSIQYIFMTNHRYQFEVSVGDDHYCDKYLYPLDIEKLAKNDGFQSLKEFKDWFVPLIEASAKHYYTGKIIHWTDFRY